ncbi:tyrosine-type recombinase/integrase [Actinomadura verrucosospora]|uniref:tyrosine-type recombinase/integrase n=1 Tax=Actinomadura verrucosospora TaxID=46165 RepID=UPI0035E6953E
MNVAKLIRMGGGRRPKAVVWTPERVSGWFDTYTAALEEAGEPPESRSTRAFKLWRSLPRPSRAMVWTPEQTGGFLAAAAEYRLYAPYHLMTFAVLRRGETCGLEWADVDLDARELSLYIQIVHITYAGVEEADLKSDGSKDTIPFDTATGQVLRAQQREERLAWVQSGKVFTRENGERLHPDHASAEFQAIAFTAGLPPIRLHDLRDGTATLMLAGGADMKLVQAQLRHSSISLTADTYTSVLPDVAREAVEGGAAMVPRAAAAGSASTSGLPSRAGRGRDTAQPLESAGQSFTDAAPHVPKRSRPES